MIGPEYHIKLKHLLANSLPGKHAQYKMAPAVRLRDYPEGDRNKNFAGVLILLFPENHAVYTILIRRTLYNGNHSGQISLPGGKQESQDPDLVATALREAEEEIGISPDHVDVLGKLTPLYIPVSNYHVQPVIGFMDSAPAFKMNAHEVLKIHKIRIDLLTDPSCLIKAGFIRENGRNIRAPYYRYGKLKIWGATAMILSEFIELNRQLCLNFHR